MTRFLNKYGYYSLSSITSIRLLAKLALPINLEPLKLRNILMKLKRDR